MRPPAFLALVLAACGTGGAAAPTPDVLFADATLRARAEAAPELLHEAEATLARARAADDADAAADLATEARLLFLAAAAEGERRLLAPAAPTSGAPGLDPADGAAVRRHALAVALASTEAEGVTEAARGLEETRWRSRADALLGARRAALDVVVARARVLLGALAGPGAAEATEVAALGSRLEELRARRDPTEALDGVDRFRRELEARIARPGATARDVVEAASSEGLAAEPIDGLWVVDLGPVAPRVDPPPRDLARASRVLARLGARRFLLVAEGPPRAPVERALASAESALVEAGIEPSRMTTLAVTSAGFPETRLTLRFVGYPAP